MTRELDHVFLTRFNLPSKGVESIIRAQENWLVERISLFERYTIPSMEYQSLRCSHWIVYLDPESPLWLRERMDRHATEVGLVPLYRERVDHEDLIADIRGVVGRPARDLVTTNIDNDDGLSVDFVERLLAVQTTQPRLGIYLRQGLIKGPDAVFLRDDPVNAFCSVRERWNAPLTCWSEWHNLLDRQMPTTTVGGAPAWLQVVHGQNVSNRVRGRLISPAGQRTRFPGLIDDVQEPTSAAVWGDRLVQQPRRLVRESARRLAKDVVLRAGGKAALDRVKVRIAGRA